MKYIETFDKKFESRRFRPIPVQIDYDQLKSSTKFKEFWSVSEQKMLINFFESNGYNHGNAEEWDHLESSVFHNEFLIGATYIHFCVESNNENSHPFWWFVLKVPENFYYVTIQQDESEDEIHEEMIEYWECDRFQTLMGLIENKTNLS